MCIDYKIIGQRIKKIRKQKCFTQEKLAEILEISTVYVSQMENGKTKLSLEMLVRIANLLEMDPGYFLTGVSYQMRNYLKSDLDLLLQECPPERRRLIMEVAKLIAKHGEVPR
jgi:transcriptional regulator with XRE-family HTH domain